MIDPRGITEASSVAGSSDLVAIARVRYHGERAVGKEKGNLEAERACHNQDYLIQGFPFRLLAAINSTSNRLH